MVRDVVDGRELSHEHVQRVLSEPKPRFTLSDGARERIVASRAVVEAALEEGSTIYGVNTGFGWLAGKRIPKAQVRELQKNLLLSHACGVGEPLPDEVVALALLFRANALAVGRSGVRPVLLERLLQMIERGVRPVVPAKGSVGASGDLAPLAHLALPLIGEGWARLDGEAGPGRRIMERGGVELLALEAKEGLALVNGIQVTTAIGAKMLDLADRLVRTADLAAAMSLEALLGTDVPFDPRIQAARPHPGQAVTARNVKALLVDSEILPSHRTDPHKVQDAYSLRCVPQVHGAARDALRYAAGVLYREVNSATDNPLVFAEEGEIVSGGNFHGEPVALVMDHAALALHELGAISERRVESLVNPALSDGLPPFLAQSGGIESGHMLAQVTAASLVCENRTLLGPSSAESLPTSANQEDHVSLSPLAARRALEVGENLATLLAIELLTAVRGLDLRGTLRAGRGVEAARAELRRSVPARAEDRPLSPEIAVVRERVLDGSLLRAAEEECGELEGLWGPTRNDEG